MGGGAYWYYYSDTNQINNGQALNKGRSVPGVNVALSEKGTVSIDFQTVGTARARQSVEVVALSAGRVEQILFSAGDRVSANEALLRLESRTQDAEMREAQATLMETKQALDRSKKLLKSGNVSDSFNDQANAAYLRAQAAFDRAQQALMERTVRAPFSGVTGFRQVDLGDRISTETKITVIDDLSEIDVGFKVPERFFGRVKLGQEATVETSAFPDQAFKGKVTQIGSRIEESSRAFDVRVSIPNQDYTLPAGLFMTVNLVLEQRESILVPEAAVVPEAGETYVYVVADGKAERHRVRIGQRRDGKAEILDNLSVGLPVVTRGIQKVSDGKPVKILNEDALQEQQKGEANASQDKSSETKI
jgi:membrane fusion protein (multidrug efflux system)